MSFSVQAFRHEQSNQRLSQHFKASEFRCKDGAVWWFVAPELVELLEKIRAELGAIPLVVISGYRTPSHNKREGGSPTSFHMGGLAADFYAAGVAPGRLAQVARAVGAGGVGTYSSFVHVDIWERRDWVR